MASPANSGDSTNSVVLCESDVVEDDDDDDDDAADDATFHASLDSAGRYLVQRIVHALI